MLMTRDEIKAEIAAGGITAIALDTTIFEKSHNRFEHAPLSQLKQFLGSGIHFLISDVVAGEVKSHVIQDAKAAKASVRAAMREMGQKWQTTREVRDAAMATLLGGETPEAMFHRRFDAFTTATGMTVVRSAPLVSVDRLLADYFAATPPFATNAVKKSEFPDAIALHALEKWANDKATKILVVTKDGDWKSFCEPCSVLVVEDELTDALSLFHQDATVVCALISTAIAEKKVNLDGEIEKALQVAAEYLHFVPEAHAAYYYEAELDQVEVEAFELLPIGGQGNVLIKPVDHDTDYLVAEALVRVTLAVSTSFSFSISDSIDRDEVPIGSTSATESIDLIAKVFVTFEGDLAQGPEVVTVEAEFERRTHDVYYGEVGLDWDYEE